MKTTLSKLGRVGGILNLSKRICNNKIDRNKTLQKLHVGMCLSLCLFPVKLSHI